MYRLLFEKRVFKDFERLPQDDLERIANHLQALNQNPVPPGAKKLVGERTMYRIRQGVYRIVYTVDHTLQEVRILGVRHRKDAYR